MDVASGVRFTLVRDAGTPLTYRGRAVTSEESVSLVIVVDDTGATAHVDAQAPSERAQSIARQAAALVRATLRSPDGVTRPPQKIVRWRATVGEKPRG